MDFHSCAICKMLCICASFFLGILSSQTPPACQMGCGAPTHWKRQAPLGQDGSVFRYPLLSRSWQQEHVWTRETVFQTTICIADTHTSVPPLLPPQDICWDCTASDQTPIKSSTLPDTRRYLRWLRVKRANALISLQVYFLSFHLGGILRFF